MAPVKPLRCSVMLTWPSGPALRCTLPVERTNRSTTWWPIGKTVVPGAGWRGVAAGLVVMMSTTTASSKAPTSVNRRGRRHAGGTWASTSAERELDDALLRTVAKAAELPASMRRKAVSAPALCRALLVRSLRDSSGPPSPVLMSSSCSWFQYRARRYAAPAHRICFGSDECSSTHSACLPAAAGHTAVWVRLRPSGQLAAVPRSKAKDVLFGYRWRLPTGKLAYRSKEMLPPSVFPAGSDTYF